MRRGAWTIFTACAVLMIAALSWITHAMVGLDRAERTARAEASRQESLRLALWRMDSWFGPLLAREAARPHFEYLPFQPQERAYTRLLYEIEAGAVQTASPLLTFESEFVRLHFQQGPDGRVSSPQVPTGNLRDLAEGVYLPPGRIAASEAALATVRAILGAPAALRECVAAAEAEVEQMAAPASVAPEAAGLLVPALQEWAQRKQASLRNTLDATGTRSTTGDGADRLVTVGPLVPVWSAGLDAGGPAAGDDLLFVRRVQAADSDVVQGFLCDWPKLRSALLREIADLFPDANLVPLPGSAGAGPPRPNLLATIPARLDVPAPGLAAAAPGGSARTILVVLVSWGAVLVALAAVAVTLRTSLAVAEKRARFASAVTHELRTPLTTFRMYAEMLAEGMVTDEDRRRSYLRTLKDEADRLGALVENVLAYARLERGVARAERRDVTLAQLLDRVRPGLERQAERAGMTLEVETSGADVTVRTDVEAVEQILQNLVDNAGKYAGAADDRRIHLQAAATDGRLTVRVRDHGPGIPPGQTRAVFAPFERGAREPGDGTPGVGLGLALARGLARALGGDLRLDAGQPDGGACFELSI